MENLTFDAGVREYKINGMGVLRFNPSDPNLYARFLEAADKMQQVEQQLAEQAGAAASGAGAIQLLARADRQMKEILGWVFGNGNDFDKILGGVSLMAVAGNGERMLTNLLALLQPIVLEGAERCAKEAVGAALEKADARRAQ